MVGINEEDGTITNSYATGNVVNSSSAIYNVSTGGLIGSHLSGIINNSYASGNVVRGGIYVIELLGTVTNGTINGNQEMKSESEMKQQSTFYNWDFGSVWRISPEINNGFPSLRNVGAGI